MPDPTPNFTPKKQPNTPEIPEGFDGVAVPSANGEATYYSRKGLKVGSRVSYTDENGTQRAWVIQSLNEEKDADGQTYIKAEHVEEGAPSREVREGALSPTAPMPALEQSSAFSDTVPGIGTLSQGTGPSPVERFQEMIKGLGKSVVDAVHGQVAVPTAIIEDRLFGRSGEAAHALQADDPSAGTAFGRSFGQGAAPAGGGLAAAGAGAGVGAEIGSLFGPAGSAIGGAVGGIGGGLVGGVKVAELQDGLLKQILSPEAAAALETSNAQIAEKQPAARDAGALAAQALFVRPNLSLAAPALASKLAGGAIAGGIDAAQQKLTTGQVDLSQTGRQIAGGVLLSGANTKAGDLFHDAGAAAGRRVAEPVVRFTKSAASAAADSGGGVSLYSGIDPTKLYEGVLITPEETLAIAKGAKTWKDWFSRHEPAVQEVFGEDAPVFRRLLAATSQGTGVPANVTQALKAYKQYKEGTEFRGYLPAVRGNLERVRREQPLNGPKISQFDNALAGDPGGVAIDRHLGETLFGTKKPSPEQVEQGKKIVTALAEKLGWTPREVQSALWAHNQVRQGREIHDYGKQLEQRRDIASALRTAFAGGEGDGVQQGGGPGEVTREQRRSGSAGASGRNSSGGTPEGRGETGGQRGQSRPASDHPVGAALYSGIDPRAISEGLRVLGRAVTSVGNPDGTPRPSKLENVATLRKAGLLTNPATHARNILGNAVMQAGEEAARLPASIADIARVAVAKAAGGDKTALGRTLGTERTTGGVDLVAVAKASGEGVTRGGKEALEILKTGKVENDRFDSAVELEKLGIDREYSSHSPLINGYVNGVFRILSAEDRLFRTYAFARSISEQATLIARAEAAAIKSAGKEVPAGYHQERARELSARPSEAMSAQAIADAEVSTFNNTNALNDAFSSLRQKAKNQSPALSFSMDAIFPFTKTPTNVLARILEYSVGTVYGPVKAGREVFKDLVNEQKVGAAQKELSAAKSAQVADKGTGGFEAAKVRFDRTEAAKAALQKAAAEVAEKAFTPEQQRAFAQTFGRGSVGLGLIVMGYQMADKGVMTGSNVGQSDYQKREKAGTSDGAVYAGGMWHDVGFLAPVGTLLVLGATIREQEARGVALPLALAGGVGQQIGEAPMLSGTDQFKDLGDAGKLKRMIGGMAGSFVPAAVAATAQAMDTRKRKPETIADQVKQRIPGLRSQVPVNKKAKPGTQTSPFNPFRSKAGPISRPNLFKKKAPKSGDGDIDKMVDEIIEGKGSSAGASSEVSVDKMVDDIIGIK